MYKGKKEEKKPSLIKRVTQSVKNAVSTKSNTKKDEAETKRKPKTQQIKEYAENKFVAAVEKEEQIAKRVRFFQSLYYVVSTLVYAIITVITVFTEWDAAKNPWLVTLLLAAYIIAIGVVTALNFKKLNAEKAEKTTKVSTAFKDYGSVTKILKKVISLIGLGLSLAVAIESWDQGFIIKGLSILFIGISLVTTIIKIVKEISKIVKRSKKVKKESKYDKVRNKARAYADTVKTKRNDENAKLQDIDNKDTE